VTDFQEASQPFSPYPKRNTFYAPVRGFDRISHAAAATRASEIRIQSLKIRIPDRNASTKSFKQKTCEFGPDIAK
jgi:hypothetical protein